MNLPSKSVYALAFLIVAALALLLLPVLANNGDYGVNTGRQPGQEVTSPPTPTSIFSPTPPPPPTATPVPPTSTAVPDRRRL